MIVVYLLLLLPYQLACPFLLGIGEHPQHLEEMDKLVDKIATAEDKLQSLNKHFNNTQI